MLLKQQTNALEAFGSGLYSQNMIGRKQVFWGYKTQLCQHEVALRIGNRAVSRIVKQALGYRKLSDEIKLLTKFRATLQQTCLRNA